MLTAPSAAGATVSSKAGFSDSSVDIGAGDSVAGPSWAFGELSSIPGVHRIDVGDSDGAGHPKDLPLHRHGKASKTGGITGGVSSTYLFFNHTIIINI